jgi:hypothetical protein
MEYLKYLTTEEYIYLLQGKEIPQGDRSSPTSSLNRLLGIFSRSFCVLASDSSLLNYAMSHREASWFPYMWGEYSEFFMFLDCAIHSVPLTLIPLGKGVKNF